MNKKNIILTIFMLTVGGYLFSYTVIRKSRMLVHYQSIGDGTKVNKITYDWIDSGKNVQKRIANFFYMTYFPLLYFEGLYWNMTNNTWRYEVLTNFKEEN